MAAEYRLWEISIHYDSHHIDGKSKVTSWYQIPGRDKEEALQKARDLFSEQEWKGKELVKDGRYDCKAVILDNYGEYIRELRTPLPKLSGPDAGKFKVEPRLSENGRNIEYIVNEK